MSMVVASVSKVLVKLLQTNRILRGTIKMNVPLDHSLKKTIRWWTEWT